jgi:hypothetical protein
MLGIPSRGCSTGSNIIDQSLVHLFMGVFFFFWHPALTHFNVREGPRTTGRDAPSVLFVALFALAARSSVQLRRCNHLRNIIHTKQSNADKMVSSRSVSFVFVFSIVHVRHPFSRL